MVETAMYVPMHAWRNTTVKLVMTNAKNQNQLLCASVAVLVVHAE